MNARAFLDGYLTKVATEDKKKKKKKKLNKGTAAAIAAAIAAVPGAVIGKKYDNPLAGALGAGVVGGGTTYAALSGLEGGSKSLGEAVEGTVKAVGENQTAPKTSKPASGVPVTKTPEANASDILTAIKHLVKTNVGTQGE